MSAPVTGGSPDLLLQDCSRGLSEWMEQRHCRKCNGDMRPSKAIEQTWIGMPDFIGTSHVATLSPGGPGRLVDCLKCSVCGWSISA